MEFSDVRVLGPPKKARDLETYDGDHVLFPEFQCHFPHLYCLLPDAFFPSLVIMHYDSVQLALTTRADSAKEQFLAIGYQPAEAP